MGGEVAVEVGVADGDATAMADQEDGALHLGRRVSD